MIAGTVYGVVLNDAEERDRLAPAFAEPPYRAPPVAPVLYIKPRTCLLPGGGRVAIDGDLSEITVAPTIGLVFGHDVSRATAGDALAGVAAAVLALDLSEPSDSYYRPAVRQRCRDGFLPVGPAIAFAPSLLDAAIVTHIDAVEVHRWSLDRLVRDAAILVADVSAFMTLAAGDMLLVGLPHDAPRARAGQHVAVEAAGFPGCSVTLIGEEA